MSRGELTRSRAFATLAAAAVIMAGFAVGAFATGDDGRAASADPVFLIDKGVSHLKRTTLSYPQWLRRDYPPGVRETTEWGQAFASFDAAKRALQPPPPPPPATEPSTTTHPPPPPPPPPTTTTTTTTEPPPPSPPPGYPDASNTGVTDEAALTYWPGHEPGANPEPVYITQDGAVVENRIFRRIVTVMANNVRFRNVRFKHSRDFFMLRVEEAFSADGNVLVEDSEFDGECARNHNAAVAGPGWTLRRVEIKGNEDGAKLQRNTHVYDSWIHSFCSIDNPDPHYDGLQSLGGFNNKIVHNTIDVGVGAGRNAAVFFRAYPPGPNAVIRDVTIEDNRLLGGGWTFACCSDEGAGPGGPFYLRNNKFGPYAYGPVTVGGNDAVPGVIFRSGNVWDETATAGTPGEPIPGG